MSSERKDVENLCGPLPCHEYCMLSLSAVAEIDNPAVLLTTESGTGYGAPKVVLLKNSKYADVAAIAAAAAVAAAACCSCCCAITCWLAAPADRQEHTKLALLLRSDYVSHYALPFRQWCCVKPCRCCWLCCHKSSAVVVAATEMLSCSHPLVLTATHHPTSCVFLPAAQAFCSHLSCKW
jgi:hypothetical protein